ncbi:protein lifeguard 4 isoform X1 [Anarrhichthys ocellatus]|uniref:protein lifeguard 4 isoform X1 n=2 Tax=Anarrhichthys ocellatus TaxID=433405 RepID=UPI0012EEC54A|nr:protein lifeguard 4 isoform X1 [Anarrhichthys ocellatus]
MSTEKYPRSSIEDDFNYGTNVATASIQIRMDFLRKVYTLLSVQIILTTATSALFMFSQTIKEFVHTSPAVVLVSALGSLVVLVALAVYRHQHPVNLYLLLVFTLLEAISVATALTFYEYSTVLQALFLTCAVFAGLTIYTFQSKRDFSKLGAGLFACLWILLIASCMRVSDIKVSISCESNRSMSLRPYQTPKHCTVRERVYNSGKLSLFILHLVYPAEIMVMY